MRELGRLSFKGHSRQVTSLAASPDGNMLLSGGEDNKVLSAAIALSSPHFAG